MSAFFVNTKLYSMRTLKTIFICLLTFAACTGKTNPGNEQSQSNTAIAEPQVKNSETANDSAINMIHSFYDEYIPANNGLPVDEARIKTIKKKYCTARLLNVLQDEEIDYDPFLNAQDCDLSWLNTLSVKRDAEESDLYHVQYKDTSSQQTIRLKLRLKNESGTYKIDKVYSVMETQGM